MLFTVVAISLFSMAHVRAQRFPQATPIKEADPSIRHNETIQLPTKLYFGPLDAETEKTLKEDGQIAGDYVKLALVENSAKPAEITVGSKMIVGVRTKEYIYLDGEPRPTEPYSMGYSGVENLTHGAGFLHRDAVPIPGKTYKYVLEEIIEVFETNMPAQHMWSPEGNKFKVLLTRTLKESITLDFPLKLHP